MDENYSQPEDNFDEIEETLKRLQPSGMKPDFLRELESDHKNVIHRKKRERGEIVFARFVPLAVAACLVLVGYLVFQLGLFDQEDSAAGAEIVEVAAPKPPSNEVPPEDQHLIHGLPPLGASGEFRPVSAEGIITNSSPGRIVSDGATGELMREETMTVLDVYMYVDPETGTRIRQFVPRDVTTLKPVSAD